MFTKKNVGFAVVFGFWLGTLGIVASHAFPPPQWRISFPTHMSDYDGSVLQQLFVSGTAPALRADYPAGLRVYRPGGPAEGEDWDIAVDEQGQCDWNMGLIWTADLGVWYVELHDVSGGLWT